MYISLLKTTLTTWTTKATVLIGCLCCLSCLFISCSEADEDDVEFADWQSRNENYFNNLYAETQAKVAAGDSTWQFIRCFVKADSSLVDKKEDYIIVQHIESAPATQKGTPLYTDSVDVHYRGWLIPSVNYPAGYEFDSSYRMEFDPVVCSPSTFTLNSSLVLGFSTALQHMRRGDHWRVWIPYQLGYGTTDYSTIPGYSTLIFELWLEDFWH